MDADAATFTIPTYRSDPIVLANATTLAFFAPILRSTVDADVATFAYCAKSFDSVMDADPATLAGYA